MPIAPRFHIEHLHKLALQIKRAPSAVRLLQIQAAEELSLEIDEETIYPFDYVVYRITKYRVDGVDQPLLLGSALIGDLVAIVAIVSRTLDLPAEGTLTVEEAASQLGVSKRTTSRLRGEGLLFRWVVEKNGRRRLGCSLKMLHAFKCRHKKRLDSASNFSRLSLREQQLIIKAAMEYSGSGRSLSDVAAEISNTTGRGHETIRSLLRRSLHTKQALEKPPPLTRKDARVIERAVRFGVPWSTLVARYQRSIDTLRKAVARLRATRLKQMEITYVAFDVFTRKDADEIILGAAPVLQVGPPVLEFDLLELDDTFNEAQEPEEIAVVSAMNLLRRRSLLQSRELGYTPSEEILDRIETDLRWAFLLQQQLILMAMPSALAVAVQHVGRPLQELPSNRMISLVEEVIRTIGSVCGSLDPSNGQFAKKTPASVLDRVLAVSGKSNFPTRAAARHEPLLFSCPFHAVVPWSKLLPKRNLPLIGRETSSELEELLALRFGWMGHPRTINEIANEMGRNQIWVKRQLRSW